MPALLNRVIIAEVNKEFKNLNMSFLDNITSYNDKVYNDTINFIEIGADPNVLIDNTIYPIASAAMSDGNIPVALHKLETENTIITDDELYAIAYDKKSAVRKKHMDALKRAYLKLGAHALAPASDTADTPVILTTGNVVNNRKKLIPIDLISLKRRCDDKEHDEEGRTLTLCTDHVNDMLEVDQSFRDRYHNTETGKLITRMHGFDIFETVHGPSYNGTTNVKKAYGAAAAATDIKASVYHHTANAMKAVGSTAVYYSDASTDPVNRRSLFGLRQYVIVSPVTQRGQGSIITAYVP